MQKIISVLLCFLLLSTTVSLNAGAVSSDDLQQISAQAYVLYCVDNGQIVASNGENKRMKPASTTKLMTTLITLEQASSLNKKVTFTQDMVAEGSSMYLKLGDMLTLKDLATGMMMASGNDAANAAAISIAGDFDKFADMMNNRAKQIGMKNTHFVTPSGLDDENHYSTAYDMALLMSYALENEDFAQLTSKKSASVEFIKPNSKKTTYANHNRLLSIYDNCIGGKTGYTLVAGRCLVSAAKKDGLTLVCVTLNDRKDWDDHISLYEYGFNKLCYIQADEKDFCIDIPCVGSDCDRVSVVAEGSGGFVVNSDDKSRIKRKIYLDSFLYAPIIRGEIVGKIKYETDGKALYCVNLIAATTVNSNNENKNIFEMIKEFFTYG